jgi:hypothetical protein
MNSAQRRKYRRKFEHGTGLKTIEEMKDFIRSPFKTRLIKSNNHEIEYVPDHYETRVFFGQKMNRWEVQRYLKSHLQADIPNIDRGNIEKYYSIEEELKLTVRNGASHGN